MNNEYEKHRALAQDIAAIMRKHSAYATDITFSLRDDGPFEQARMTYNAGRHGSEGIINLIVTTRLGDFREEPRHDQ